MHRATVLLSVLLSIHTALSLTTERSSAPTVHLPYGTFQGSSANGVDKFLGMRFAQAGRFELPKSPSKEKGVQQATSFGPACPQQFTPPLAPPMNNTAALGTKSTPVPALTTSEDCLFVNVIRPSNIHPGTKLPVLFWIYGGGFEDGDTSSFNGSAVVARSIALGEPVIYVSANYRLNAFGFSGSREIRDAGLGNLGLRDQRFAMEWVQDNIHRFGGDKTKVTIWGESAGAISVGIHMVINHGNPAGLFRGAFMQSGSPNFLRDITVGQPFFDQLVHDTGCSGSPDVIACLKGVPLDIFQTAVNKSPNIAGFMSLILAWLPRVDGDFVTQNPQDSIANGTYAKIPFVTGDCDDEGTIFAFSQLNLTTDQEAADYLHNNYYPNASDAQFAPITSLYPSDPVQGSPFNTGTANQLSPQFKRIAAFGGDQVFQAPRRFFLQTASKTQNAWSYLFKRGKNTPFLGAAHGSDIPEFYGTGTVPSFQGTDALLNFANHLNPNNVAGKHDNSTLISWPMWKTDPNAPPLLTFTDPNELSITQDTYRVEGIQALINLQRIFP